MAALADALGGGAPILPVPPGTDPATVSDLLQQPLPDGTAVVVRTSGSSGVPKAVALSAEALVASAAATHEALSRGESASGQWLVNLPGHLISGLQMLVRSEVAGTTPVFVDGPFDPEKLIAAADRMSHVRRYVSLVPVQLSRLLDLAERDEASADTLRGLAGVLVGGQATPLPMRQRAHDLGIALRRSYGMTETSGGCVYDGVEIGDTRVRVRDGEVQIAGSCLALGYVGDAELTAQKFVQDQASTDPSLRWYRTGDAGDLLGGMLRVTGRLDRVIISGGVNVSLDEVERVAREHPGWSTAVAIGTPHPEWGQRVGLVVEAVPASRSGSEPAAAGFGEVRAAILRQLGPAAAPEWVTESPALPRLEGGKPDLPAIERWVGELRQSFRTLG